MSSRVDARGLDDELAEATDALTAEPVVASMVDGIWARDAGVWTSDPVVARAIGARLGWLDLPSTKPDVYDGPVGTTLLIGMGGSSLGAEACADAFGNSRLTVLDSTVPEAVRERTGRLGDLATVIVASKSGTTLETIALEAWSRERFARAHTRIITDPGSPLEALADASGAALSVGRADVGGRFSVLSSFGTVPCAALGIDPAPILNSAAVAAQASRAPAALGSHSPPWLACLLSVAVATGHDRLTLLADPGLKSLADWIEQLVAESTGKAGRGVLPICHEPELDARGYGDDRLFVSLEWATTRSGGRAPARAQNLIAAGHPVVRIVLESAADIGAEFFRWQFAVALYAALDGTNPFDEPDVVAAKEQTRRMLAGGNRDAAGADDLVRIAGAEGIGPLAERLGDGVLATDPETVLAWLAYLPDDDDTVAALHALQSASLSRVGATTLGWGPRYLHSTGQFHKGGVEGARYVILTLDSGLDYEVPGLDYGLGALAGAQAAGDREALRARGRVAEHVHLTGSPAEAAAWLRDLADRLRR